MLNLLIIKVGFPLRKWKMRDCTEFIENWLKIYQFHLRSGIEVAISNDFYDAVKVVFGELSARWQTQPSFKEAFTHLAPSNTTTLKHRLQVHGSPSGVSYIDPKKSSSRNI